MKLKIEKKLSIRKQKKRRKFQQQSVDSVDLANGRNEKN